MLESNGKKFAALVTLAGIVLAAQYIVTDNPLVGVKEFITVRIGALVKNSTSDHNPATLLIQKLLWRNTSRPIQNSSRPIHNLLRPIILNVSNFGPGEKPAQATVFSWIDNNLEYKEAIRAALKTRGFEPTFMHDFKSPFIIDPKLYPPYSSQFFEVKKRNTTTTKTVACYNCPGWFSNRMMQYNNNFQKCAYSSCHVDLSNRNYSSADVVIFFIGSLGSRAPPPRPMGQIWVMATWESGVHTGMPRRYDLWKNAFNWTFNFRLDSTLFSPNNRLAWRDRDLLFSDEEYLKIAKRKTKTAVWWVSNCSKYSKRIKFTQELQKYVDVDIYGGCGKLKCPRSTKKSRPSCWSMLNTTYKFYLGFENSFCADYVTEKAFNTFDNQHIVHVVRGAFDYGKYLPPGTVINTADFKSVKLLAEYLKELGKDERRYANMLKEIHKLKALNIKHDWCDICEKLHTNTKTEIIPDIKKWYHNDRPCYSPNDV